MSQYEQYEPFVPYFDKKALEDLMINTTHVNQSLVQLM
jgi:hypothetical protein